MTLMGHLLAPTKKVAPKDPLDNPIDRETELQPNLRRRRRATASQGVAQRHRPLTGPTPEGKGLGEKGIRSENGVNVKYCHQIQTRRGASFSSSECQNPTTRGTEPKTSRVRIYLIPESVRPRNSRNNFVKNFVVSSLVSA